jgi:cell volume regulation protein A
VDLSNDLYWPLLVAASILLLGSVLVRPSGRFGVPTLVVYLGIGFVLGSDVTGWIPFDDAGLARSIGIVALAIIIFEGGLQTPPERIRSELPAIATLATAGVVLTAGIVALVSHALLDLPWLQSLLLGAIVGSTDAAAVFAVLRGRAIRDRVARVVEGESGANDPMAILLMLVLLEWIDSGGSPGTGWALGFLALQFCLGAVAGVAGARITSWLVQRMRVEASGLYPLAILSSALAVFAAASLVGGSGYLAVYVMGILLAGTRLPYHATVLHFHDGIAWMMQISMFVILGLLAFPREVLDVAFEGVVITITLLFVARPVAVLALLPRRFTLRERAFVAWAGLRGAVPIVLATYPLVAGVDGAETIFDVVVFVVVGSALLQGSTLPLVARWLGVDEPAAVRAPVSLELEGGADLTAQLGAHVVAARSAVADRGLAELEFPRGASVSAVVRGTEVLAPTGGLQLRAGDIAYVLVDDEVLVPQVAELFDTPDAPA